VFAANAPELLDALKEALGKAVISRKRGTP
jgi:hypothetical protein